MNLEDHLGDIIRKARAMSNISPAAAAKAAGLTEPELAALEDSGTSAKKPDYDELAELVGPAPTCANVSFFRRWASVSRACLKQLNFRHGERSSRLRV